MNPDDQYLAVESLADGTRVACDTLQATTHDASGLGLIILGIVLSIMTAMILWDALKSLA